MTYLKKFWSIIKKSFLSWRKDNANLLSAALSYYTLFSLAPILLIIILIVGTIVGEQTVKTEIIDQVQAIFGQKSAGAVSGMIERIRSGGSSYFATIISLVILFFASTNLFKNLKKILNLIWGVKPKSRNWFFKQLIDRLLSFAMVLIFGFLFLATFIIDTALVGFGKYLEQLLPHFAFIRFWEMMNFLFSVVVMSILFAIIFKVLPETSVTWWDVWLGAVLTAILFTLGKLLIGFYIGNSRIGTIFGAASSIIVILIWVYYSAHLLFFGAEVTRHFAYQFGSHRNESADDV